MVSKPFRESGTIIRDGYTIEEGILSLMMLEGRCLGYGRVESFKRKRVLKSLFDIGDFLRRERWRDRTP